MSSLSVGDSQEAGVLRRKAFHFWLSAIGSVLLITHVVGMALAGFTQGISSLSYVISGIGLIAVPICAWQLSRRLDPFIEASGGSGLAGVLLRFFLGFLFVAFAPVAYRIVSGVPLLALGRVLELSTVVISLVVLTGLVLISFGVADFIFFTTQPLKHLGTRLMVLLAITALAHFFWLTFLGYEAYELLQWAIAEGHLEKYVEGIEWLSQIASFYVGGIAGAIGLELPFLLIMAWRFGRRATAGLDSLHHGFRRVAEGDFDEPVRVIGNDEVAEMQRGFNEMLAASREQRFLENAFGRYVSPFVLQQLRQKGELAMLKGERRIATVLFSDIRGFTALSAVLAPEQVIAVLNAYMSRMIETIARFDGYINKFVGDAIMVVWNAPLDQEDHSMRALACARAMQDELERANREGDFRPVDRLTMGIGINTGPLVAGNLGNERQVEFTVLGDTVNVASRACSHAEEGQVVLTKDVVDAAREVALLQGVTDQPQTASIGTIDVKGKGPLQFFLLESAIEDIAHLLRESLYPGLNVNP